MEPWVNALLVIYCIVCVGLSILLGKKYKHAVGCGVWAFNAVFGVYLLTILNLL